MASTPPNSRARPSVTARTPSSPITPTLRKAVPVSNFSAMGDLAMLTPPSSPARKVNSSSDLASQFDLSEASRSSVDSVRQFSYTDDGVILCPYEVEIVRDAGGQQQTFGSGAWSTVYKATCRHRVLQVNGALSPPSRTSPPLVVAVKTPSRKDAVSIIRSEAKVLSYLRQTDTDCRRIACFYGIVDETSSLVLDAVPLCLEEHIKSCALVQAPSPRTPMIGNISVWLDLASKLISALSWLHNEASVVHGDIKPGNIVLKPINACQNNEFPYQPLFIDFSSAQRLDSTNITPNTLSAVTMEYTAPELLKVSVMKDPLACATPESDVFSMGVTLLVAATGDTMVYTGCSVFQRRALATSGNTILGTMRSISTRVPRCGIVGRVVEKAFLKNDMGRISTREWMELVKAIKKESQV